MSEDKECNKEEDTSPGIFSWRELFSGDPVASQKFYTELLGWTVETMPMPSGDYTMFMNDGQPVAGLNPLPDDKEEAGTAWVNYITVEDLDTTLAQAEQMGAKACMPPVEIPGKGRFVGMRDPQGAPIAFWEFAT